MFLTIILLFSYRYYAQIAAQNEAYYREQLRHEHLRRKQRDDAAQHAHEAALHAQAMQSQQYRMDALERHRQMESFGGWEQPQVDHQQYASSGKPKGNGKGKGKKGKGKGKNSRGSTPQQSRPDQDYHHDPRMHPFAGGY